MLIWPILILLTSLLFFAISLVTRRSPAMQNLLLKPGRHVEEIQVHVRLLTFATALMLIVWTAVYAASPEVRRGVFHGGEPIRPFSIEQSPK
jgi:hypothetical protein